MYRLLATFALATLPSLAATAPVPAGAKDDAKTELARLSGTWEVVSLQENGVEQITGKKEKKRIISFTKDGGFKWEAKGSGGGKIITLDPGKKLKEVDYVFTDDDGIDVTDKDGKPIVQKAIYKLEGDTFTDCCAEPGDKVRPTEFKSTKENGWSLMVYKRVKKID